MGDVSQEAPVCVILGDRVSVVQTRGSMQRLDSGSVLKNDFQRDGTSHQIHAGRRKNYRLSLDLT